MLRHYAVFKITRVPHERLGTTERMRTKVTELDSTYPGRSDADDLTEVMTRARALFPQFEIEVERLP